MTPVTRMTVVSEVVKWELGSSCSASYGSHGDDLEHTNSQKKPRQHYVSQFYLRLFESASHRIHIFNLRRSKFILHASLRTQCYGRRIYGRTDALEDEFMDLENRFAPVIRRVATQKQLPESECLDHYLINLFVAVQLQRTASAIADVHASFNKLREILGPDVSDTVEAQLALEEYDPMRLSLAMTMRILDDFRDLRHHLFVTDTDAFIMSDSPIFKYNQYCEGTKYMGTTGALQHGLQIFVPLSPQALLLLYDSGVYRVGNRSSSVSPLSSDKDVIQLNSLQAVSAINNLYFSDETLCPCVQQAVRKRSWARRPTRVTVAEATEIGNPQSGLVKLFQKMPNLRLRVSPIRVLRKARRVEALERPKLMRQGHPAAGSEVGQDPRGVRRFVARRRKVDRSPR